MNQEGRTAAWEHSSFRKTHRAGGLSLEYKGHAVKRKCGKHKAGLSGSPTERHVGFILKEKNSQKRGLNPG